MHRRARCLAIATSQGPTWRSCIHCCPCCCYQAAAVPTGQPEEKGQRAIFLLGAGGAGSLQRTSSCAASTSRPCRGEQLSRVVSSSGGSSLNKRWGTWMLAGTCDIDVECLMPAAQRSLLGLAAPSPRWRPAAKMHLAGTLMLHLFTQPLPSALSWECMTSYVQLQRGHCSPRAAGSQNWVPGARAKAQAAKPAGTRRA